MTLAETKPLEMPRPLRFTRQEYYQMADLGFFNNKHVELIEGEIVEMAPQKNPHPLCVSLVHRALMKVFDQNYWIRIQAPLSLGADSDPEPDLAIVPGSVDSYRREENNPATALLVVEVSDTTLHYDRTTKAALYARAGIREYWIVNLRGACLEIMRDPIGDSDSPGHYRYGTINTLKAPATISPVTIPAASIPIADLLP